jgi:hypothetical protein
MDKKGFASIILVVIVAGLLIGGGAWFYSSGKTTSSSREDISDSSISTSTEKNISPVVNNGPRSSPKSGWTLYQNSYELPFFYPKNLTAYEIKRQFDEKGNYKGANYKGDVFEPFWEREFVKDGMVHPLLTTGFTSEAVSDGERYFFPIVFQVLRKDKGTLAYSTETLKETLRKQNVAYGEVQVGTFEGVRMPLPQSFAFWEIFAGLYDDMWLFGDQYAYRILILNNSGLSRSDIFANTTYQEISGQLTQDQVTEASQNTSIKIMMVQIQSYAGSLWAEDLLGKPGKQADACEGPLAPEFFRRATTTFYLQSMPKGIERGCNVSADGWTALIWVKLIGKNSGYWCINVDITSKYLSSRPPIGSVYCPQSSNPK